VLKVQLTVTEVLTPLVTTVWQFAVLRKACFISGSG